MSDWAYVVAIQRKKEFEFCHKPVLEQYALLDKDLSDFDIPSKDMKRLCLLEIHDEKIEVLYRWDEENNKWDATKSFSQPHNGFVVLGGLGVTG